MRSLSLLLIAGALVLALVGIWAFVDGDGGLVLARGGTREGALGAGASVPDVAAADEDPGAHATGEGRVALGAAPTEAEVEAARPRTPPCVTGRVLSPEGAPLPGAQVLAAAGEQWGAVPLDVEAEAMPRGWPEVKRAETDAEGRFRFEGLKSGSLRLVVRARACVPRREEQLTLPPGYREHDLGDLALTRGVALAGHVVDRGGKPVAGAALLQVLDGHGSQQAVSAPGRGILLATSAADGSFEIDQLAAGPWHLFVDAAGYQVGEEEGRTSRPGERQGGLRFLLEAGAEVAGRVVAGEGVPPAPDLFVVARVREEREAQERPAGSEPVAAEARLQRARAGAVDEQGAFRISGLERGRRYRLTLWQRPAEGAAQRVPAVDPIVAWSGERGLAFQLKPEAALRFRVVDAASSAPLTDFVVWCGIGRERVLRDERGQAQRSFPDGRVRYPELRPAVPPKPALLRVRAPGYREYENKNVQLVTGGPTDLGEIRLERAPQVLVRVIDERDQKPVEGARVLCGLQDKGDPADYLGGPDDQEFWGDSNWQFARTGPGGEAAFNALPGKLVALRADATGFLDSETEKLRLPAEGDTRCVLRLKRGGSVRVRISDAASRPVIGVGVAHRAPSEQSRAEDDWEMDSAEQKSDARGETLFRALAPGVHSFRVHDQVGEVWHQAGSASSSRGWVETTVAEGSETVLELLAPPRGAIFGVVREGGRPLEGASLKLTEEHEGDEPVERGWSGPTDPLSSVTDHEGRYRLEGLRCGSYRVSIHHPERRLPARFPVEVRPAARPFDFDLDVTAIEGRVSDVQGRPLAGLEVHAYVPQQDGWDEEPYQLVLREDERGAVRVNYEQRTRRSERTDSQGRYVLRGLVPNQPLVVHIEGDVVETLDSAPVTLAPDEVRRGMDFALRLAGMIRVELEGGEPNQGSWYEVRALLVQDGKEQQRGSAWVGSWNRSEELRSLSPGKYKLVCSAQGGAGAGEPQVVEVEVREGETARAVFQAR